MYVEEHFSNKLPLTMSAITGGMVDAFPLMLNGAIGAHYHIPYPIVARASFGYYLARFAVVTRMATALFWHAIQSWTGSTATFQMIRAIWPGFLDIPNRLPASAGITSNELIAHFVFFCIQFPAQQQRRLLASAFLACDQSVDGDVRSDQYLLLQGCLWGVYLVSSRAGRTVGWPWWPMRSFLRRLLLGSCSNRHKLVRQRHFML
jgi:hypothetical protein